MKVAWHWLIAPVLILRPCSTPRRPLQILTAPRLPQELTVIHNDVPSRHHCPNIPFHPETLEHRVVDMHVMRLGADSMFCRWTPQHDIGIASCSHPSLAGINSENAGGRGRHQFHETIQCELPFVHAVMINQLQSILYSRP